MTTDDLDHRFNYHAPDEQARYDHQFVRDEIKRAAASLADLLPGGQREVVGDHEPRAGDVLGERRHRSQPMIDLIDPVHFTEGDIECSCKPLVLTIGPDGSIRRIAGGPLEEPVDTGAQ